jgi:hypothetical protein
VNGRVVKMTLGDPEFRLPSLHRRDRRLVRVDRLEGRGLSLARLLERRHGVALRRLA